MLVVVLACAVAVPRSSATTYPGGQVGDPRVCPLGNDRAKCVEYNASAATRWTHWKQFGSFHASEIDCKASGRRLVAWCRWRYAGGTIDARVGRAVVTYRKQGSRWTRTVRLNARKCGPPPHAAGTCELPRTVG